MGSLTGEIAYKQDVAGRRVEKKVDGYSTRYVCDGDSVIAEYDGNNNLLRKYIYGPGIDKPVCMIEVADSNAVYYYHFDALGSVVALSDTSSDPPSLEPFQADSRKLFYGKAMLILRSREGQAGQVHVTAESDGMTAVNITLQCQ
jgi:hypothetical protein